MLVQESQSALTRIATLSIIAATGLAAIATGGWASNYYIAAQIDLHLHLQMAFSVAFMILLLCASWFTYHVKPSNHGLRMLAQAFALGVLVFSILVLIEFLTRTPLDIEEVLMRTVSGFSLAPTGRMSPIAAAGLVLASTSLAILVHSPASRNRRNQLAAILALLLVSIGLVLGAALTFGSLSMPDVLSTAISLVLLGIGVSASAGPTCWPMRIVAGQSVRAQLLRAMLPLVVTVVVFLGWFGVVSDTWIGNRALTASFVLFITLVAVVVLASRIGQRVGARIEGARDSLEKSEDHFRRITENMLDMVVQTDVQGICEYASPSFKTVLGYDPKYVLGRSLFELVHPDDLDGALEIVLKALANSSAATFDYRCKHADGHYVWLESVGNPIFDKTGQMSGTVLATRDITERKRADDALRESEAKYRTLIEQSLQGIAIAQGAPPHLVFANPAFAQMLGYTPDELTSLSLKETEALVHPEDRETFFGRFSDRLQGEPTPSHFEFRAIRKDGEVRWMETSSNRIEYHGRPALQSTFIDRTKRRKAENALKESEERYKAIFDGASDGFLAADVKTSKFVFANPKICEMTGYSLKELLELSVNEIHPKKEVPFVIEQFERQARGMIDVAKEIPVLRKDKTVLYCDINSKIIEIKGQRCLVGIFRDVTERRQVERLKDQFVSMVSHELRTPLTSIRASLGLLASSVIGALPEKGQRMLDIAVTNTDRLVRLINDILDSERLACGKTPMEKKQCSTAQLVKQASDVMKPMAEKAGVSLSVESQDAELWVDPDRIVQALTNLISNAIKFSSKGSKICVAAERKENQMLFKVQNEGQGIPADKLGLLFERFQQLDSSDAREKGGSGLGLSISRSIIEQHNGKIWVESTVGKGSTFLFTLPLTPETQIMAQPEATTEARSAGKVLIIEDDPDLVNILKAMLQRHDIQLYIALTGEKGITLSKQLRPDIIVLDLGLPDMDGSAVVHALREDNTLRSVPLVVYTARELDKRQQENLRLGETIFFTKSRIPPDQFEDQVVQFVKRVLEHRGKTNAS